MTARIANPRIVITGMGVVSAWGWGIVPFRQALSIGGTAVRRFSRFDHEEYSTHLAAQVPAPGKSAVGRTGSRSRMSLADRYAVAAAVEAVEMAGLAPDLSEADAGVFFASSTGGMFEGEEFYQAWRREPGTGSPRRLLASHPLSRPGEAVARALHVAGPVDTVSSACASGALALGAALDAMRAGEVGIALAGGADSLCRTTFGGFNSLQAVDEQPCRPFRSNRSGMSLGEGGAVLILEQLDAARARGAIVLAELKGAGASSDAYHMTAPHPAGQGAATALSRALLDAGCDAQDVDLINAHGTGTRLNDAAEYQALVQVFGSRAGTIPVEVTKASVGHLLGCAGAIEAVATILALRDQQLQPTPGGGDIDPGTPVRLVRDADPARLDVAVSLNLGFGGCNGALVIARCEDSSPDAQR